MILENILCKRNGEISVFIFIFILYIYITLVHGIQVHPGLLFYFSNFLVLLANEVITRNIYSFMKIFLGRKNFISLTCKNILLFSQ